MISFWGALMFSSKNRLDRWTISEGRLTFSHPEIDIYWEIPSDFKMPSSAILGLAEYVLLTPFKETVELESGGIKTELQPSFEKNEKVGLEHLIPTIGKKDHVGVAFSGGVDSTAVLDLLPSTIPIYTLVANPTGQHKIENALLSVEEVGGVPVISNYDELGPIYGKRKGFWGDAGFTVTAILYSEYYNFHTIADGNVLETMYLFGSGISGHGVLYQELDRSNVMQAFRNVGLEYCIPCAGLTEVSTTKIAMNIGYKYSMGCMRGIGGKPCNNCLKCFRKRGLQGKPIDSNKEVELKLNAKYIPMLPSLLWAKENKGLSHPVLENVTRDISWVDKWYEDSLRYIPEYLHAYFIEKLKQHGIGKIVNVDPLVNWTSDVEN